MHEFSIAQNIVRIVKDKVSQKSLSKVTRVKVKVGELSGVVPDALKFSFRIIAEDSKMRSAQLDIDVVPLKVKCKNCGNAFKIEFPSFICSNCLSSDLDILSGNELFLESIEVEDTEESSDVASSFVKQESPCSCRNRRSDVSNS